MAETIDSTLPDESGIEGRSAWVSRLTELDNLDPTIRGRAFESLIQQWLTADPAYAAQIHRVWLWSDWPGRWGPDTGIDLVAETHEHELWAVQTKAYTPEAAITKAGIDSFLSESSRSIFVHRLLVATTDRIGANALRALHGQEKSVGIVRRSDLFASAVQWPATLTRREGTTAARREARPHQREAIADVTNGLAKHARGQLLMACGTGKTLTALWVAEALDSMVTLVLVPSLSLLEQTMREWVATAYRPFRFLAVCSDETVAPEHDEPIAHTADLGVPVTTDANRVRAFLEQDGRRVIFATYHSSPVIAGAQEPGTVPQFDLVVADEAHRCAGAVSGAFATVLDNDRIVARRRLFMTATPRYFTRVLRGRAAAADLDLASMDDEDSFGPVLHRLSFGSAIERGLLSDYRVVVTAVDHPTYADMVARATLVRGEGLGANDAKTLATQLTVLRAMRRYDLRRLISFHSRVRRAQRFAEELPDVASWAPHDYRPTGRLWTSWVSGELNVADRAARLNYLRNLDDDEHAVLSNARCLAEGVDVPSIDAITFVDPRGSQIEVVQAVGRAIRLSPNKTLGTIILPVVIEPGVDPEVVLESSEFRTVWAVVNALRAHDDDLAEELDYARRELGRTRLVGARPRKLILDLPVEVDVDFARAFDAHLIEVTTSSWDFWCGLLEAYVEQHGHARMRQDHEEAGYRLGAWVAAQRWTRRRPAIARRRRVTLLTPDRIEKLESLPGWQWSNHNAAWEDGFAALCAFADIHGGIEKLRGEVVSDDGYPIGSWVRTQRKEYNRGRLSPERAARLESHPAWTWAEKNKSWEDAYQILLAYVERVGSAAHGQIPKGHIENGFGLHRWVVAQRTKAKRGELTPAQVALLEEVPGWTWGQARTTGG